MRSHLRRRLQLRRVDQVAARQAVNHDVNECLGGVTKSKPIWVRLDDSLKKAY